MEGVLKKAAEEDHRQHLAAGWEGRRGTLSADSGPTKPLAGVLQIWGQKQRPCLLAPLFCEKQEARTSEQSAGEERGQGLREGKFCHNSAGRQSRLERGPGMARVHCMAILGAISLPGAVSFLGGTLQSGVSSENRERHRSRSVVLPGGPHAQNEVRKRARVGLR